VHNAGCAHAAFDTTVTTRIEVPESDIAAVGSLRWVSTKTSLAALTRVDRMSHL
jgi:hypothetical protein